MPSISSRQIADRAIHAHSGVERPRSSPLAIWLWSAATLVVAVLVVLGGHWAKQHRLRVSWSASSETGPVRGAKAFQVEGFVVFAYWKQRQYGPLIVRHSEQPIEVGRWVTRKHFLLNKAVQHLDRLELEASGRSYAKLLDEPVAIGRSTVQVYEDYCIGPARVAYCLNDFRRSQSFIRGEAASACPLPGINSEGLESGDHRYSTGMLFPSLRWATNYVRDERLPLRGKARAEVFLSAGQAAYQEGSRNRAVTLFKRASEIDPGSPVPHPGGMARAWLRKVDPETALRNVPESGSVQRK